MTTAVLLGVLQGVAEWLPVSSEGLVAAAYSLLEGESLDEAVGYALWLHVGTMPAALVVLRREGAALAREVWRWPKQPSSLLLFLVVSTLLSMAVALPLVLLLGELSGLVGASAMGLVGVLMLVTGALQVRGGRPGDRDRTRLALPDALLAGVAQGLSVLPGFSRSGLTVAALLGRGVDKREALVVSFLMSIPASAAAATYAVLSSGFALSAEAVAAAAVAFVVGLAAIRALLAFAQRVNLGLFVLLVGLAMTGAAVWDALSL